jgi:NAD(P)H-hydrate repair Nnr-like enzyme with NAD(P)H-hydrate epimerase domain
LTGAWLQIPRAPFILYAKRSTFNLFIFPRAIDLILDAIIGYSLSGSARGAEGRGAPETK